MTHRSIIATVKIRRDLKIQVRDAAELIDGMHHHFTYGWTIDDLPHYCGEVAWIADSDADWPTYAPHWIASGDLTDIVEDQE